MSKSLIIKNLGAQKIGRSVAAISLALSVAALGCTTDRHLGNGDPITTPGIRTSPTGGTTAGSETAPSPPPMMSSYTGTADSRQIARRSARVSADEAAAIMAQHQQASARILGPSNPAPSPRPYASDAISSAARTNQQLTVNSTISSQPVPAIVTGAGGADGGTTIVGNISDGGVSASLVSGATANGVVIGGNASGLAAPVVTSSALSPTGAAIGTSPGAFALSTTSPTASSVANLPASVSGLTGAAGRRGLNGVAARTNVTASQLAAPASTTAGGSVRLVRNGDGRVVVTNVSPQ